MMDAAMKGWLFVWVFFWLKNPPKKFFRRDVMVEMDEASLGYSIMKSFKYAIKY